MRRPLVLFAFLFATPLFAGAAPEKTAEILSVKGYASAGAFTLELVPGTSATEAIRIYSEPSHTLLTVVEDADFAATEAGRQWHARVFAEMPRSGSKTSLPEGRPRIQMEARPAADDRIVAWVYGSWPDGKVEDRMVGDHQVSQGAFELSMKAPAGASADSAKGGE